MVRSTLLASCIALLCLLSKRGEVSAILPTHVFLEKNVNPMTDIFNTSYSETFVDHFNFADQRVFKLKYLQSNKFFKPGGPILFYTGNESPIEAFAENAGFLIEHAGELNAAVVFAEHRYYGASMPFGNQSFKSSKELAYLTSSQALQDFANLVRALKRDNPEFKDSAVIAIGGSYGGILSAWFREKYPNLVAGAISASAPIWMFTNMSDCGGFNEATSQTFNKTNPQCYDKIKELWASIQFLLQRAKPLELLQLVFHVCDQLTSVQPLQDYIVDFLGGLAMFDYPYETSFLAKLPANPVAHLCNEYVGALGDRPQEVITAFAGALLELANYTGQLQCINLTVLDTPDSYMTAWDIQTCMEMTYPTCSNGHTDFFPVSEWNEKAFVDRCQKQYGLTPRFYWAELEYWGKNLKSATNILFSNGGLDPWTAYGVTKPDQAPNSLVIVMPNGAHHSDLRAHNDKDTSDVLETRIEEVKFIKKCAKEWLEGR